MWLENHHYHLAPQRFPWLLVPLTQFSSALEAPARGGLSVSRLRMVRREIRYILKNRCLTCSPQTMALRDKVAAAALWRTTQSAP